MGDVSEPPIEPLPPERTPPAPKPRGQWFTVLVAIVSTLSALTSSVIGYVALTQYRQSVIFGEMLSACADANHAAYRMRIFLNHIEQHPPISEHDDAYQDLQNAISRFELLAPIDFSLRNDMTLNAIALDQASTDVIALHNAHATAAEIDAARQDFGRRSAQLNTQCRRTLHVPPFR